MINISNKPQFILRATALGVLVAVCSIFLSSSNLKVYADETTNSPQYPGCSQQLSTNDPSDPSSDDSSATINNDTSQSSSSGNATVVNNGSNDIDPNSDNSNDPNSQTCTPNNTNPEVSSCSNSPDSSDPSTSDTTDNSTVNTCSQQNTDSGQATVEDTSGGSSTSGNSDSSLNQVNEVSTDSSSSSQPSSFTDNVYGNQNGNIEIDPGTTTSNSSGNASPTDQTTTTSTSSSSTINNTDNVASQTGDASVTNDGSGGTATSGNAVSLANVVNVINSMISSNQSFVGTINIYGNLYGDIQLPQQLVNELLSQSAADGTSAGSLNEVNNADIDNNISLMANSGNATVSNDGNDGTATSGNATTQLYTLNNIDSAISASNLFLIIVNVSGQWYGYVLGATPTSDVILLGSNILNNEFTQSLPTTTSVNDENINNSIALTADTGNATVDTLGSGGTATSGDAEALANVVNLINDEFDISNWFGILFINIFGNWYGSLSTYSDIPSQQNSSSSSISTSSDPTSLTYGTLLNSLYFFPTTYWTSTSETNYQTYYTTSYIKTYKNVDPKTRYVSDFTAPKESSTKNHWYYWTALLSLIPIVILIVLERRFRAKNRNI